LLGIRPPANRVAYIGQSFPGRPPVIFVLVAVTLLAHCSNDSWCWLLLRFTNNAVRRDVVQLILVRVCRGMKE
jgi:hypothetical protein